jgi:hypothetical protein
MIPKIQDCIAYIEGCGWKLQYFNRPWYVFKSTGTARTMGGSDEITFTLTEIRHAKRYGW